MATCSAPRRRSPSWSWWRPTKIPLRPSRSRDAAAHGSRRLVDHRRLHKRWRRSSNADQQVALESGTIAEGGALDSGAVSVVTGCGAAGGVGGADAAAAPLVVVCGSVDVVVVSSNTCRGALASGAAPRKMLRMACMFSEFLCQIRTSLPPTFLPVASIWYVWMSAVSTPLTTPTNWIILSMV